MSGQAPLALVGTIDLPGVEGRIDHLAVDTSAQRLFLAALGNNTDEVLDLKGSRHLKSLAGFREPQGIALARDAKLVAIANGQGTGVQFVDASEFRSTKSGFTKPADPRRSQRWNPTMEFGILLAGSFLISATLSTSGSARRRSRRAARNAAIRTRSVRRSSGAFSPSSRRWSSPNGRLSSAWPRGTRLIQRFEHIHPGPQERVIVVVRPSETFDEPSDRLGIGFLVPTLLEIEIVNDSADVQNR